METRYIVESDIIIRAVDKPFHRREPLGIFSTKEDAYHFILSYLSDTRKLHTYFSRTTICTEEELEQHILDGKMVALNVVLGQFEDMLYISKVAQ